MMKKYWGKSEWSESLYLCNVIEVDDPLDIDWHDVEQKYILGMRFDWKKIMGFVDRNKFEDTNSFITYPESFNVYQMDKI